MKNILVPVGSTENGITNLRYAVQLASMSGAKVYLINIYKEFSKAGGLNKVTQVALDDNEAQLAEVQAAVDVKDVEVVARAIKGNPFEGIARVAKQLEIDLMVLSPQSLDIRDEVYLGTTTSRLVRSTDIPILVIPHGYIFRKIESILLAVKRGYFEREGALEPLKTMARLFSAKVNLLLVRTADVADDDTPMDAELQELQAYTMVTDNATIYQGVLEHFQENNPDMLCVLRRKRGFFKKLWESNAVMKSQFFTSKPLLILRGEQ